MDTVFAHDEDWLRETATLIPERDVVEDARSFEEQWEDAHEFSDAYGDWREANFDPDGYADEDCYCGACNAGC